MKNDKKLILILSLTVLLSGCATTTQLRKSWSDPSVTDIQGKTFTKILVMVISKNVKNKMAAEDKLVANMKKGIAIPAYIYVTPADTSQKILVERLIKDGFDGVITLRVKAVVQTQTTNPGTSYASWYGYSTPYGFGYTYSANLGPTESNAPPTVDINSAKDYIVETNIYSLDTKKLLWSGVTASMSAKKLDPAIIGIVTTVRKELKKKGFITNK